ncbi:MAG: DNA mismatch repair protein MutS [Thalassobius sp.]|nr:DNA mismatch repair protein MutS [Thalassovita sp.]
MNIGDRVRSISGSEEGVVTSFRSGMEVEVEIEDGFRIPYMRTDLVVISESEKKAFGDDIPTKKSDSKKESKEPVVVHAHKGIFLGFHHYNDKMLEMHLANNTDMQLSYVFCEEEGKNYMGISSGVLRSREVKKIHEVNIDKFEKWPAFVFQVIYFTQGKFSLPAPLITRLKFRANSFFKHKKEIPLLGKEGYCFQIDEETKTIDPQKLKESLTGGKNVHITEVTKADFGGARSGGRKEVDLHIEKFDPQALSLSNEQIISRQLNYFENELDKAIFNGVDEIIFIHGVGAGVLKAAIHQRLSGHQHVAYFKDAHKQKFGYGATLVKIK